MKNHQKNTDYHHYRVSHPRTLITTPVLNLISGRVHCRRSGIEKDFFKLEFTPWVNVVACTAQKEIIFIRQYRFGTDRIELEIPGGAVNVNETPLEGGLRELLEETGYAGQDARIIGKVCPNPAIQDNFCYTVLVENVHQVAKPNLDEMEDIEVLSLPEEVAFGFIRDGTISHGLVQNGLMFYAMTTRKI